MKWIRLESSIPQQTVKIMWTGVNLAWLKFFRLLYIYIFLLQKCYY